MNHGRTHCEVLSSVKRVFPESLPQGVAQVFRSLEAEQMTVEMNTNHTPLETAILETLDALTPEWQSFAGKSTVEANRQAMQRLILCGFAKTRLTYTVTNTQSGRWVRLRYILSGQFVGDPLMKFVAAQCPRNWFSLKPLEPIPDVIVATEENDWTLAITADGSDSASSPRVAICCCRPCRVTMRIR